MPDPMEDLPRRILIVDDDSAVLSYLSTLLKQLRFIPIEAMVAADALNIFQEGAQVDLLISDVRMPGGMDGFELAKAVRQARPGLPILLISGYSDITPEETLGVFDQPKVEFIPKPFTKLQLERKLQALFSNSSARASVS